METSENLSDELRLKIVREELDQSKRNRPPPVKDRWHARFARGGSFGLPEFFSKLVAGFATSPRLVENSVDFKKLVEGHRKLLTAIGNL